MSAVSTQTLPATLERLACDIQQALDAKGQLSPQSAKEIVLNAKVSAEDLAIYADFDHPVEDCYGRKMIYETEQFEIMAMSWKPGDYSSIHNHGYTQWGTVQVFGNAHHFIYCIKDDMLRFSKKEILTTGEAVKVNNALIHQMGNPSSEPYMTLHVYGINQEAKGITADAKGYELEKDRIVHTSGGAFFNLPETEIYDFEKGVKPTQDVFMTYAYRLLSYYNRQKPSTELKELKRKLLAKMGEYSMN